MRIWIVKYGESIPFAAGSHSKHFFRSGEIARRLSERGHEVTWWTGRFEHQTKRFLEEAGDTIGIPGPGGSRVVLLPSPGYATNVSPRRFYDHWVIGRRFREAIRRQERPDVIVASMPTPELARVASDYAAEHGVPLILDVRDMWPDVIVDRVRSRLRLVPRWLFAKYERDVRSSIKRAASVTSITRPFLEWAQDKGGRTGTERAEDRVFHLASRRVVISSQREAEIRAAWKDRGFEPGGDRTVFALAGSLTNQAAMRRFFEALPRISPEGRERMSVVICGGGDLAEMLRQTSAGLPHVIYAGFVARDEVQFLYDHSHYGLLMYDSTPDFKASFPNKFGEYLMSGLSVVTSIDGAIQSEYGQHGFIENVGGDATALARRLEQLALTPPQDDLRTRARAVFERDFNAEVVYRDFCDHIEHWAGRRSPKAGLEG